MKAFAQELRKTSTEAEKKLWYFLRNRQINNFKFRRQYWIDPFIVDFICLEKKLILEIDGSQHMEHSEYDEQRTVFLQRQGFRVIRFWNNEVLGSVELVLDKIIYCLLE